MREAPLLLEFENVSLRDAGRADAGLRGVTFALRAGESLAVRPGLATHEEEGWEFFPLADGAQGLLACGTGAVRFMGRDWREMGPREQGAARGRMGRVFPFHGWVNNLTVLENLTLGGRFHRDAPEKELRDEALGWARRFGLRGVPDVRPGVLRKADLRRLEWVRAFLGQPAVILLESPEMEAPRAAWPGLCEAAGVALTRGAAVLWITDDETVAAEAERLGAVPYEARGGVWRRAGEAKS